MLNGAAHIYLDNQSTTRVDDRVAAALLPYLTRDFGNPSGEGDLSLKAAMAINHASEHIATLLNCSKDEIYFTSGATESLNWAIRGIAEKAPADRKHIITTAIEHNAVLKVCEFLEKQAGFTITRILPREDGIIDPEKIKQAIRTETLLVAVHHANNEIGVIQPIKRIGQICQTAGVVFVVDAAQSVGKIACDFSDMHIDFLAASGHKIYAPKGIGIAIVRDRIKDKINPLLYGGGQQGNFRSGTQNVPYIVGLGEAARLCLLEMKDDAVKIKAMRDDLLNIIKHRISDMKINGSLENRLPGNLNFSVPGVTSDKLLRNLRQISLSKGSACNSHKKTYSHVLSAITTDESLIVSAIRIGVGRFNTPDEIRMAANKIADAIEEIKNSNAQF